MKKRLLKYLSYVLFTLGFALVGPGIVWYWVRHPDSSLMKMLLGAWPYVFAGFLVGFLGLCAEWESLLTKLPGEKKRPSETKPGE